MEKPKESIIVQCSDRCSSYRNVTWLICFNALCIAVLTAVGCLVKSRFMDCFILSLLSLCFYILMRVIVLVEKKFTNGDSSVTLNQRQERDE